MKNVIYSKVLVTEEHSHQGEIELELTEEVNGFAGWIGGEFINFQHCRNCAIENAVLVAFEFESQVAELIEEIGESNHQFIEFNSSEGKFEIYCDYSNVCLEKLEHENEN